MGVKPKVKEAAGKYPSATSSDLDIQNKINEKFVKALQEKYNEEEKDLKKEEINSGYISLS